MSKKLAALLFAIATGASATTAVAQVSTSCSWSCKLAYDGCIRNGYDAMQCDMDRVDCLSRCGI